MESRVCKVALHLEKRELGGDHEPWPPGEVETIWADLTSDNHAIVNSTPFFANNVSYLDVLSVTEGDDLPFLTMMGVVRRSGHDTVRVILIDDLGRTVADTVLDRVKELGCNWESGGYVVAIDISPGISSASVLAALIPAQESGAIYVDIGFLPLESS